MMLAPWPADELARLMALHAFAVLDVGHFVEREQTVTSELHEPSA